MHLRRYGVTEVAENRLSASRGTSRSAAGWLRRFTPVGCRDAAAWPCARQQSVQYLSTVQLKARRSSCSQCQVQEGASGGLAACFIHAFNQHQPGCHAQLQDGNGRTGSSLQCSLRPACAQTKHSITLPSIARHLHYRYQSAAAPTCKRSVCSRLAAS